MEFADVIKSPKIDDVVLSRPLHDAVEGTLCITSHHVILSSRKGAHEELWILHRAIDVVERKLAPNGGTLILKCKDFRILLLEIPGLDQFTNAANSIETLSGLENCEYYYPFFHQSLSGVFEDGWSAFLSETEFSKILVNTDEWRLSHVNKDFSICPSYPQAVVVPKSIDDLTLSASASFRYNGRFPVCSYCHADTKAAILRCSQPLVGTNNRRCKEDEKLINAVLGVNKKGYIIDTRTQNLAQLSRTKGGGVEPEMHYPMWRRIHKPIDRHSTLLDSLAKLVEACSDTSSSMDKYLSRLESSGWLNSVKDVLTCACLVAQCIDKEGASVVIHGAEGTDATLQVCALAQVILDPDCRTIRGFEALVEREWLQAGHPFTTRCHRGAFTTSSIRTKDQSPTFLMFLDCVYQIHYQFPCSFEFNESFLILLFEHAYASQFGTFLGNCEKDRLELKLAERTVSLWSHVNQPSVLPCFFNPVYEPNSNVIWPSVAPQSLLLWPGMYLRWVCNTNAEAEAWKTIAEIKEHDKALKSKALKLRRQLVELERQAVENGLIVQSGDELIAES